MIGEQLPQPPPPTPLPGPASSSVVVLMLEVGEAVVVDDVVALAVAFVPLLLVAAHVTCNDSVDYV